MYIRFVVSEIHCESQKRMGLFHALRYLREDGELLPYEEEHTDEIREWFGKNLEAPTSFSKAKTNRPANKAISWFKDSATEHISKMREIAAVLEAHGIQINTIKTDRPGYIVYEDEFQITAEPFKETET